MRGPAARQKAPRSMTKQREGEDSWQARKSGASSPSTPAAAERRGARRRRRTMGGIRYDDVRPGAFDIAWRSMRLRGRSLACDCVDLHLWSHPTNGQAPRVSRRQKGERRREEKCIDQKAPRSRRQAGEADDWRRVKRYKEERPVGRTQASQAKGGGPTQVLPVASRRQAEEHGQHGPTSRRARCDQCETKDEIGRRRRRDASQSQGESFSTPRQGATDAAVSGRRARSARRS